MVCDASRIPPGARWITISGNHVLIDANGNILSGLGGRFNGVKVAEMGKVKKEKVLEKPAKKNAQTPAQQGKGSLKVGQQPTPVNRTVPKETASAVGERRQATSGKTEMSKEFGTIQRVVKDVVSAIKEQTDLDISDKEVEDWLGNVLEYIIESGLAGTPPALMGPSTLEPDFFDKEEEDFWRPIWEAVKPAFWHPKDHPKFRAVVHELTRALASWGAAIIKCPDLVPWLLTFIPSHGEGVERGEKKIEKDLETLEKKQEQELKNSQIKYEKKRRR